MAIVDQSPLGKNSAYVDQYDAGLLFPIPRVEKREELGLFDSLPFQGEDIWNAYEISWLNSKGKPQVALGEFRVPADSPNIIESKSFKLYLNSFNQSRFADSASVSEQMAADLSKAAGAKIDVSLKGLQQSTAFTNIVELAGECIDGLDIEISPSDYQTDPSMLRVGDNQRKEQRLVSHLLKSNCLVTGQPDWGSVVIDYQGPKIDQESLLRYLISFRQHNEFHEQCVERIFTDLMKHCHCERLSVYARYVRRGGLDINPYRSTHCASAPIENWRLVRQ